MRFSGRTRGPDLKPRKRPVRTSKPLEHGTEHAYACHACRCAPCKTAVTAARKERNAKRAGIPPQLHGRPSSYFYLGCRCDKCRQAAVDYRKRYEKCSRCRKSIGTPNAKQKYCSDECRIAANVKRRRKTWRESKKRNYSLANIRDAD